MNYAEKCLSKGHAFFFRKARKKERDVSFSLRSSLFFLLSLFFKSVSLSKKQHPERESRERTSSCLPRISPTTHTFAVLEKVITEKTTREKT
jgi:hypothetical protein